MYSNENSSGYIKVYPNKEAIKQMKLKSVIYSNNADYPQVASLPSLAEMQDGSHKTHSSQSQSFDGFFTILMMIILLSDNNDWDGTLFTLILGTLFIC